MKAVLFGSLGLSITIVAGCFRSTTPESISNKNAEPAPSVETNAPKAEEGAEKMFSDFFVEGDSLSFNGFQIVKLHKTIKLDGMNVDSSYAILKRNSRVLGRFDGLYYPSGNPIDFGLCSLLGGQTKQLVVSQTTPRSGRHWVVDVTSDARVLFDSYDYNLGREEVFLMDVDKDGVSEIGLLLTAFWSFGSLSPSQHEVLPMIVFRYDRGSRRYLPANPIYSDELHGIAEEASGVDPVEQPGDSIPIYYLAKRLGIFLRYVYGGKREEGWAFFNKTYNLADKNEIKAKIRRRLEKEPIYKFIYRHY